MSAEIQAISHGWIIGKTELDRATQRINGLLVRWDESRIKARGSKLQQHRNLEFWES